MKENRIAIAIPEVDVANPSNSTISRLDLKFTGASSSVEPLLYEPTNQRFNFFETYTPQGVTGVTGGKRVIYENVYPYIDVHLYSNKWGPKMYIVVRPGGNPEQIKLLCTGHDSLKVDLDGFLKLFFDTKFLKLSQGIAYQQEGETTSLLPWVAHYEIASDSLHVSFEFGDYDPTLPLVFIIRPLNPDGPLQGPEQPQPPEWCTYLGGGGNDKINDLAHDGDGNLYYTGLSSSGNGIPVNPGAVQLLPGSGGDIILGKANQFYELYNPDQSVWCTYYGGNFTDQGVSLEYDPINDRLILAGELSAFVDEFPNIALSGNPTSYSRTSSVGNCFISFFDKTTGWPLFLSRVPGETSQGKYMDVDWDNAGNTYVLSSGLIHLTPADLMPIVPGEYVQFPPTPIEFQQHRDCNIIQLDPNAVLIWRTCFAGPNNEYAAACAVDRAANRLSIVGTTMTANTPEANGCTAAVGAVELPLCGAAGQFLQTGLNSNNTQGILVPTDGFIAQFDLDQRTLIWSTYFGGPGFDGILDADINEFGELYVVGYSGSPTYSPITCGPTDADPGFPSCGESGYFNSVPDGRKFFIARFATDNTLVWSTRFGDSHPFNYVDSQLRITLDEEGRPLVFGSTVHTPTGFVQPLIPKVLPDAYNRATHNDAGFGETRADCFVGLLGSANELVYVTYFGGVGNDLAGAVEAFNGRIYIGGTVYAGINFPTNEPVIPGHDPYGDSTPSATVEVPDAFLAQLLYSFTVGVDESLVGGNPGLLLFPNPTNGWLYVNIPSAIEKGILEVTDGLGRCVLLHPFAGGVRQELDISRLASGTYTLTLRSTKGSVMGRVVKSW